LRSERARLPDDDDFLRGIGTVPESQSPHFGKESTS
jgi:hypothetical protein